MDYAKRISKEEQIPAKDEDDNGVKSCAELIKSKDTFGAAPTWEWREGRKVAPGMSIAPGTAIATFNDQGRYPQSESRMKHAAVFIGFTRGGILVLDQYEPGRNINYRELKWSVDDSNAHRQYVNSATNFSTIEW